MDGKHKLFDLIQRYIRGRLSDSEREELESRMANDPELRTKVLIQQEAYRLATAAGAEVSSSVEEKAAPITTDQKTSSLPSIFWMILLVLLLLALVVWWWVGGTVSTK